MKAESETKRLKIALLAAGLMLCASVLPSLPAYFFDCLRWIVCGVAVYAAFAFRTEGAPLGSHFIPLAILVTLFNPLIPVQLPGSLWMFIHLATALYFSVLAKKI